MIVSWNWLKQYVRLDVSVDELTHRLTMAGLNHESTGDVEGDIAIDLEVTSNRPDCLGHIGIAREAAAVLDRELTLPAVTFPVGKPATAESTRVEVACPDLCPQYTARVIRGVKIGPSPDWLRRRLATCGVSSINNVVDVTNYVLLEASQPLHAFDFDKLAERRVVVRRARPGETITAINQKRYELRSDMCVIADASRAVAAAGVMGGFDTEVSDRTTNLLIESAEFDPLATRRTSRALGLSSESSYRFERGVDPAGVDWASRRCCQLITELAGGVVAEGVVGVGSAIAPRAPIVLRFGQVSRILGIDIDPEECRRILARLGLEELRQDRAAVELRPPSWRRDLEREIDLIEEVGRIHGYEHVPEDVAVPMTTAPRTPRERVEATLRQTLIAAGFHEAVTMSFVEQPAIDCFRLWSTARPLAVDHPSRRQENRLRQSLVPSLLAARRLNESRGVSDAELFELARVYLPRGIESRESRVEGKGSSVGLPDERVHLALVSNCGEDPKQIRDDLLRLKGVIENVLDQLHVTTAIEARPLDRDEFSPGRGAELLVGGKLIGCFGQVSQALADQFELRSRCAVAELNVGVFHELAQLIPRFRPVPSLPAVKRELTIDVDKRVSWAQIESAVRRAAGRFLEEVHFADEYDQPPVPAGKKSVHFGMTYRAPDRTLTREEVDQSQQAVIAVCRTELAADLRGA